MELAIKQNYMNIDDDEGYQVGSKIPEFMFYEECTYEYSYLNVYEDVIGMHGVVQWCIDK
jgi:hypothetical protein